MERVELAEDCTILLGDVRETLKTIPSGTIQTCVTSPPYLALRDYGVPGQIGLEATPEEYVTALVEVFREVRRVLRDDGTVWLNLGDTYASKPNGSIGASTLEGSHAPHAEYRRTAALRKTGLPAGLKHKDLIGVPWLVAFALRADGWWLRSEIIWHKLNCMPESVIDRPTKAHEQMFLLSKSGDPLYWVHRDGKGTRIKPPPDYRWINPITGEEVAVEPPDPENWKRINLWQPRDYYYDSTAVEEPAVYAGSGRGTKTRGEFDGKNTEPGKEAFRAITSTRNKRDVWTVASQPYPEGHFAVFPPALIDPCILAGSSPQACPICGAPWERLTEKVKVGPVWNQSGPRTGQHTRGDLAEGRGKFPVRYETATKTTGWAPTCSCEGNDGSGKSIVLDPFSGSGTTGQVALQHGRAYIGCELNPEYLTLTRKRLNGLQIQIS